MALFKLQDLYEDHLTFRQLKLLQELTNKQKIQKISIYVNRVGLLGKSVSAKELCAEHYFALQRRNVTIDRDSAVEYYKRVSLSKEIIHSKQYTKAYKRNSYTVLLNDSEIFEIEKFLVANVQQETKCFAFGKYFMKQRNYWFQNVKLEHMYFANHQNDLAVIEAQNIEQEVTVLQFKNDVISVICKHPNKFEMLT